MIFSAISQVGTILSAPEYWSSFLNPLQYQFPTNSPSFSNPSKIKRFNFPIYPALRLSLYNLSKHIAISLPLNNTTPEIHELPWSSFCPIPSISQTRSVFFLRLLILSYQVFVMEVDPNVCFTFHGIIINFSIDFPLQFQLKLVPPLLANSNSSVTCLI